MASTGVGIDTDVGEVIGVGKVQLWGRYRYETGRGVGQA